MPYRGRLSLKGWVKYNGKGFWTVNLYEIKKTNRKAEVSFGNKEVETERFEKGRDLEAYKANRKNTHILKTDPPLPFSQAHKKKKTNKQLTWLMHPIFPSLSGNNTFKMAIE